METETHSGFIFHFNDVNGNNRKRPVNINGHFPFLKDFALCWTAVLRCLPPSPCLSQNNAVWKLVKNQRIPITTFQRPLASVLAVWKSNVMKSHQHHHLPETNTRRVSRATVSQGNLTSATYCVKGAGWAVSFPRESTAVFPSRMATAWATSLFLLPWRC